MLTKDYGVHIEFFHRTVVPIHSSSLQRCLYERVIALLKGGFANPLLLSLRARSLHLPSPSTSPHTKCSQPSLRAARRPRQPDQPHLSLVIIEQPPFCFLSTTPAFPILGTINPRTVTFAAFGVDFSKISRAEV